MAFINHYFTSIATKSKSKPKNQAFIREIVSTFMTAIFQFGLFVLTAIGFLPRRRENGVTGMYSRYMRIAS